MFDKRTYKVFGSDRVQECGWFQKMDRRHGKIANVQNQNLANVTK